MVCPFLLTKWRFILFGYPSNTYYIKMTDGFINNFKEGALYFLKYIFGQTFATTYYTANFVMAL